MNKVLLEIIGLTDSNSQSGAYALILGEKRNNKPDCNKGQLRLPIFIGEAEARSIAIAIEGQHNIRPLTHDLFKSFASTFDISINEVVINRFKEGLFYSELRCIKDGEEYVIDARTSDAIAIAVRFNCPIYTYPQILEEAGIELDEEDNDMAAAEFYAEDPDDDNNRSLHEYSIEELNIMLKETIEDEDYVMASKLRDIINERKNQE